MKKLMRCGELFGVVMLLTFSIKKVCGQSCGAPVVIGGLPFSVTTQSTCGDNNDVTNNACGNNNWVRSRDRVYAYTPAVNEVVDMTVSGMTQTRGTILVTDACNSASAANCIAMASNGASTANLTLTGLSLTGGTTYYIAIDRRTSGSCLNPYDLNIVAQSPVRDCTTPTSIACGETRTGETTISAGNTNSNWSCLAFPTTGEDVVYSVTTDGTASALRVELTNVTDDNTFVEVVFLGTSCTPGTCQAQDQLTVSTGLFGTSAPSTTFNFTPTAVNPTTYYLAVASQGDGVTSYDINVQCFQTGIEPSTACNPLDDDSDGIYSTWNGGPPPPLVFAGETYTVCHNIFVENLTGFEWLKYVQLNVSPCLGNIQNITPNGTNNGFIAPGDWAAVLTGNRIDYTFTFDAGSGSPSWGDGAGSSYSCYQYTYCYDADVTGAPCITNDPIADVLTLTDDGIGASGSTYSSSFVNASDPGNANEGTFLPVVITSFESKNIDNRMIRLDWTTMIEIENDYFDVLRSYNGQMFESIARIPGAGTSNTVNQYTYIDEDPYNGSNYYKLIQVDFNGNRTGHEIIQEEIRLTSGSAFSTLPNPAFNWINLKQHIVMDEDLALSFFLASGTKVDEFQLQQGSLKRDYAIDISRYPSGTYFLRIKGLTSGSVHFVRFVKHQ